MRSLRALLALLAALPVLGVACRHSCGVSGAPQASYSIASCCTGGPMYYWDGSAKACVPFSALGAQSCGCICNGKDCDRLFHSREQCLHEYARCR